MPEIWIPITLAAAFLQNIRSALQKHLQGRLSVCGAAYSRFVYALPVAAVYLWGLHAFGLPLPTPNARFLIYCLLGGVCQILFTVFLLWMFSFRSFAVGTTFSKLEVIMVALLGAVLLGDSLNAFAVAAIVISAAGVVALSAAQSDLTFGALRRGLNRKSTAIGRWRRLAGSPPSPCTTPRMCARSAKSSCCSHSSPPRWSSRKKSRRSKARASPWWSAASCCCWWPVDGVRGSSCAPHDDHARAEQNQRAGGEVPG